MPSEDITRDQIVASAVSVRHILQDSDRLTGHINFYHEHLGYKPFQIECKFSAMLSAKAQPWERWLDVGTDWQPLDVGWILELGYLIVQNRAGLSLQVNPSEEEKAAISRTVLELSLQPDPVYRFAYIRPGRSFAAELSTKYIYLRAAEGIVPVNLVAFAS